MSVPAREALATLTESVRDGVLGAVKRFFDEHLSDLQNKVLASVLAIYNEGSINTRRQAAVLVRVYAAAVRARYAAALHAARPGMELPDDRPTLDDMHARVTGAGYAVSREELVRLCHAIGIELIDGEE